MDNSSKENIQELMDELNAKSYSKGESWKGYEVYIPNYEEDLYMGMPYVVLVKDGKARISTPEESLEYLDYSTPEFSADKKLYN